MRNLTWIWANLGWEMWIKVFGMASQGCLEGPEAFFPHFKPYKGLEKKKFQMPLSLGLSGSPLRMLLIGTKIKFYICANLGHQPYYFEPIKNPSWGFVCIFKRNILPRGIKSEFFYCDWENFAQNKQWLSEQHHRWRFRKYVEEGSICRCQFIWVDKLLWFNRGNGCRNAQCSR